MRVTLFVSELIREVRDLTSEDGVTQHVVFADVHAHPYRQFSRGVGTESSRLLATLKTVDEIRDFCLTNSIASAICLGDVFESRFATRYEYFNLVFETFCKFKRDGISLTILVGNHDFIGKSCEQTTVDTFSHFATIVKIPLSVGRLAFLPYSPDFSDLTKKFSAFSSPHILLAHIDVIGAAVAHGWVSDKGVKKELLSRFKLVLMGHFHLRQQLSENSYYVGCVCPQSFSEVNEPGYFATLNDETAEVGWHTTSAPKFVIAPDTSRADSDFGGNYVKIRDEPAKEWDAWMKKVGALSWHYEPPPKKREVIQREKGISIDADLKLVAETYATIRGGRLPVGELIKVGRGLLEE